MHATELRNALENFSEYATIQDIAKAIDCADADGLETEFEDMAASAEEIEGWLDEMNLGN